MAKFRILASRKAAPPAQTEFDVEYMDASQLNVGDSFRVFDTHHPVDFTVNEIKSTGNLVTLLCRNYLDWDDQFAGAIVDTENPVDAKRFGYGLIE